MKKAFTILWILLFLQIYTYAQPSAGDEGNVLKAGDIIGTITDSSTQGVIEYATVGLYRLNDSALVSGMVTATDGRFIFSGVTEGEYYIDANFIGYSHKRVSPVSLNSQRNSLNLGTVVLHPDITHIEEVEIVAQSQRVEYKIDKKVVNVAQDLTSAGGTLVNVLENTPSVEVDVEGNVSLRGSGNFQLLIDGRPSVIQGSEGLQQIPASAVQSLEIITSPSAKYDPDGNAGIINVIMKKQKNSGIGGILNASIGTRQKYSMDFLLNVKRNKFNYFAGGEFSSQKFHNTGEAERRTYLTDTTTFALADFDGIFLRKSLNLKAGFDYAINDKSTLSFSGVIGNRNFDRDFSSKNHWFTAPVSIDSFYTDNNNSTDEDEFYNLNLDYQKTYGDGHTLQASAYYSAEKELELEEDIIRKTDPSFNPLGSDPTRNRSRMESPEKELRLELDYTKPVGSGKFETGLQSRWDYSEGNYIYEDFQPLGSEWLLNDSISNALTYLDALQSAYAIYSGSVGKFEYQGGLRAEYDNRKLEQNTTSESYTYEKFHFFPSVFLTRKLSEAHQIQATYSRRIQRPRQRDLNPFKEFRGSNNVNFGNPALKPEFTNAFELNYQYNFKKGSVTLETYYRETSDKITQINGFDTISGRPVYTFTMTNADRDYALGMELMTNLDVTPWWQLNLTGNLFRYQLEGEIDGEKVTSVSTTWRTNFNSMFKLKWDTRLQLSGVYNGPSNTLQGERDGFFMANVAIRKDFFKKQLTVSLNARDVFSTGKFSFVSEGTTFYTSNSSRREAPVVMLNLSYRINNYRQNANRRENGGDEQGGMDDMM
jgi:outer membrane receptor protein involved in Fe transport